MVAQRPSSHRTREALGAKPRRGTGGRKVDERVVHRGRARAKRRQCAPALNKAQSTTDENGRGEAPVWNDQMLAALGNGVKGGKNFLCRHGTFHNDQGPCIGKPIPMRKPPTGEPCAGEPHARFGGRGGREPFPTPIDRSIRDFFQ